MKPVVSTLIPSLVLATFLGLPAPAESGTSAGPQVANCNCKRVSSLPAEALHERVTRHAPAPTDVGASGAKGASSPTGLTLRGELAGQWDEVDAQVVFSYDISAIAPDVGTLQVFVRGYPATREAGTERYTAQWDRTSYWLDFDGDGPDVPRFLPALELRTGYVPTALNDPFPEFATAPEVIAACTVSQPCTVQQSTFVVLRKAGVDYGTNPDAGQSADLLFVADASGQAVAAALDLYDANDQFVETVPLSENDRLQLSVVAFKLSEPDSIYVLTYTPFVTLKTALRIERANYVPGTDFADPDLPADLAAGRRQMKLLFDARRTVSGATSYSLGGPFPIGFTWAEALTYVHDDDFEGLRVAPNAKEATLVRERP